MRPYIGVTGFTTPQEIRAAIRFFGRATTHQLMVGVLMSSKTLRGETNKWPRRYPRVSAIHDLFVKSPAVFNVIHFATDDKRRLGRDLMHIVADVAGPHLHGFQLNVCWPDIGQIKAFHDATAGQYRIVLQVGGKALDEVGHSPLELAQRVATYRDVAHCVLLDQSGGHGKPLNVLTLSAYMESIQAHNPHFQIGVAGGLCAESVFALHPLMQKYPGTSIDAEGRLRDEVDDDMDMIRVLAYLSRAQRVVAGHPDPAEVSRLLCGNG